MIDIARDARWGRIAESPGEDPFLAARYAEAMVTGLQGQDPRAPDTVIACLKHFLAYGAAAGGRDYDNASLGPEELIGVYAEPFRAGVVAGAGSVMASFNAVNRQPMHAHRGLIEGWLRGACCFDGLVVADYTGVHELMAHGLGDRETVAVLALLAGVDMDMMGEDYLACLPALALTGLVRPEVGLDIPAAEIVAAIDRACRRVLALKHCLGLFDDPYRYCDQARARAVALAPAHRTLARRAVAASCVLLKNERGVLPISPGARVALIGRLADDRANMLGTWAVSGDPARAVTILDGLSAAHDGRVAHAKGANIVDDPDMCARLDVFGPTVLPDDRPEAEMIAEACALAEAADVVVAVIGEAKEHSGESSSRTDLTVPAPQRRLVEALAALGRPLVLVVMGGRPLVLDREAELADALLVAWFGGTEAGSGIADVLTGRAEPGGRLSVSLPACSGQVPIHHGADPTGRPWSGRFEKFRTGYLDLPAEAHPAKGLFPFGFGLGYTRFDWSDPVTGRNRLAGPDDRLHVSVRITNTGARRGTEVVQLYVTDPVARTTRPSQELKGFARVELDPGESREVGFTLRRDDLSYLTGDSVATLERVWDPGRFLIRLGPNSRDLRTVEIEWAA